MTKLRLVALITLLLFLHTKDGSAQTINGSFATGDLTGWMNAALTDDVPGTVLSTFLPYGAVPNFTLFDQARTSSSATTDSNGVVTNQSTNYDGQGPTASNTTIAPFTGTHLAFITNFAADALTNPSGNPIIGSFIAQSFFVPLDATNLTLNARYLSNEGLDTAADASGNTVGADFGGVALHGSSLFGQYLFDAQSTSTVNFHVANFSPDGSTGFGGFVSGTDWKQLSFDMTALRGQTVTLTAFVTNTGDTNFESRLLLNNVVLDGSAPASTTVPEPGSLPLLALGVLSLPAARLGRRKRRHLPTCPQKMTGGVV